MEMVVNIASIALLVLGFGFVVFWHELGHFLAAKAVGIKVEQFAVGMGQAVLCWRKGIGLTVGTSAPEYEKRVMAEWEKRNQQVGATGEVEIKAGKARPDSETQRKIADELGLGETEYRLNWMPLGGYVKMLGQDDLDPNVKVNDPRAYNNKSVSARMLVIVAGVIMNVILSALLFMGLYLWGHNVPPATVGTVLAGSPAQAAGLQVGDRVLSIDGDSTADFNKIALHVALAEEGRALPVMVMRDGKEVTLEVKPRRQRDDKREFMQMGVGPTYALRGLRMGLELGFKKPELQVPKEMWSVMPGETVVAINGTSITPEEKGKDAQVPSSWPKLDGLVQASDGKPIRLTLRGKDGGTREVSVSPKFGGTFGEPEFRIVGIIPRPAIEIIQDDSSAVGQVLPGDIVTSVEFTDTKDLVLVGSMAQLRSALQSAGATGRSIALTVIRDGKETRIDGLVPNISIGDGKKGLGVQLGMDPISTVVGDVAKETFAERLGLRGGDRIVSVGDRAVGNMFEVRRALIDSGVAEVEVGVQRGSELAKLRATLTGEELNQLKSMRLGLPVFFDERIEPRKTSNPATAMVWGVAETRDVLLQGYITIKRMMERSVSPSNLTGPVGIFHAGGKIATSKPIDWTFWFLAIISANLAVVNFLPIPIVDGGQFVFLMLEKVMGRPLSPRAQSIAQIVGIALILSVFLFVTYNDISRLIS